MQYLAAIDYAHLDNGVFLTTLARSLAQLQDKNEVRPIILHADSEYTDRIIQTGVMREQATIRSIKDLNNRLIALFADQGVSAIGINPYQRNLITLQEGKLDIDRTFIDGLPEKSTLVLSTLVYDVENRQPAEIGLPQLIEFLSNRLSVEERFIFSKSDEAEIFTDISAPEELKNQSEFRKKYIPDEFESSSLPLRLITARDFNQLPNLEASIAIDGRKS